MGLTATEGTKRTPAPAGTHTARCFGVIDLGMQTSTLQGKTSTRQKIWRWWELCEETTDDGKPVTVGSFYTLSLDVKATLRKTLDSWRGKPMNAEELKGFHLGKVLNAPCMVTVMHEPKAEGGVREKLTAVTAMPRGMKAPELRSAVVSLSLDELEFNSATFDTLPNFLKDMIAKSPEGVRLKIAPAAPAGGTVPAAGSRNEWGNQSAPPPEKAADDIPFTWLLPFGLLAASMASAFC